MTLETGIRVATAIALSGIASAWLWRLRQDLLRIRAGINVIYEDVQSLRLAHEHDTECVARRMMGVEAAAAAAEREARVVSIILSGNGGLLSRLHRVEQHPPAHPYAALEAIE